MDTRIVVDYETMAKLLWDYDKVRSPSLSNVFDINTLRPEHNGQVRLGDLYVIIFL